MLIHAEYKPAGHRIDHYRAKQIVNRIYDFIMFMPVARVLTKNHSTELICVTVAVV